MAQTNLEVRIQEIRQSNNVLKALNDEVKKVGNEIAKTNLDFKQGAISVQDYDAKIKKLETDYKGLTNEKAKINAQLKAMSPALSQAGSGFQSLISNSQTIWNGVMAAGLVQIAKQLYEISLNSAKFEVLSDNFAKQFGGNVDLASEQLDKFRTATAGNVTDANLIKLSNQASDLGVSLRDQVILFSLAEDASDKYGISVEEGFQKVIMATEGSSKGLKEVGIQKEKYKEIVDTLAKAHGNEIEQLDAETQKQIRIQAIIQASGVTYEQATHKVKDAADKHELLNTWVSNLIAKFGGELIGVILPVVGAWQQLGKSIDNVANSFPKAMKEIDEVSGALANFADNLLGTEGAFNSIRSWITGLRDDFLGLFGIIDNADITAPVKSIDEQIENATIGELKRVKAEIESGKWGEVWDKMLPTEKVEALNKLSKINERILDLTPKAKELEAESSDKSRVSNSSKNTQEKKKEKDAIDELIKSIEQNLKLSVLENKITTDIYNNELSRLTTLDLSVLTTEQKIKVLEKEKQIQDDISKILEDRQKQEEFNKNLLQKLDPFKNSLLNRKDNKSFGGGNNKLINAENRSPAEALDPVEIKLEDIFSNLNGIIQSQIMTELLGGADAFGVKLIGWFNEAISLTQSIVSIISAITNIASGGIFSFLGFNAGGIVPGSGYKDTVPAMLTPGEFVVKKSSTERYLPLLRALNGNSQSSNNDLNIGGIVRHNSSNPNITVIVESEVEKTKATRFYQNTFGEYQARQDKKSLN